MRTPTLETEYLVLKPLYHASGEGADWLNDPANVQFSEQRYKHHTLTTQQIYIRGFDHVTSHVWCIRRLTDNVAVGRITAYRDIHNMIANMGILLDHHWWRMGYGTAAWAAVLNYLLMNMRKVEAGTMAENIGMQRICTKTGMIEEGRQSKHFLIDGKPVDLIHYGKFA